MSPDQKKDPIEDLIRAALKEDLSDQGDITSSATIAPDATMMTIIHARESGTLSGLKIAIATFMQVDHTLNLATTMNDSDNFNKGDAVLTITGNAQNTLKAERVALNFLSHLSGIATQTAKYVDAVKDTNAKIYDTRKTLPAYRALHKQAVAHGGGMNHRFGLYDAILIKDNHIAAAGGIDESLNAVKGASDFIQIEVDTIKQLRAVLKNGNAHGVLLDNMDSEKLSRAIEMIDGALITEASGGITFKNVREIAETGVDRISIGALTHTITPIDFGLDITNE